MISIPASVGELIDKLSILQVKKLKIKDVDKLNFVNKEYNLLNLLSSEYINKPEIDELYVKLIEVNSALWEIEDDLRILENKKQFDEKFIKLARNVYYTNDERFRLKNEINLITDSEIREVKDYVKY